MKKIEFCFFVILLFLLMNKVTFSQGKINLYHEYAEGKINIYYEFQGDTDIDYKITIKVKKNSDSNFEISPAELFGDVGEGKFARKKNKAVWVINEEEKAKLEGEDFYFDIKADGIAQEEGIPWYYYVGGAGLAGGLAAILLIKKTEETIRTPIGLAPDRP